MEIQFAEHIDPKKSQLSPTSVALIVDLIKDQEGDWSKLVARLRKLKLLNTEEYRKKKTHLPHICGSSFINGVRNINNFIGADFFIYDIDHLEGEDLANLQSQYASLDTLLFAFVSPSGSGVKLIFRLKENCRDTKQFSDAYLAYLIELETHFGLKDKFDTTTHDVVRICFVSHDKNIYYNENAHPVDWKKYSENLKLPWEKYNEHEEVKQKKDNQAIDKFEDVKPVEVEDPTKENINDPQESGIDISYPIEKMPTSTVNEGLTNEEYEKLKETLGAKGTRKVKPVFVHEMLTEWIAYFQKQEDVKKHFAHSTHPINYGLQLTFELSGRKAMANIFYGKKGFSIVPVSFNGHNEQYTKEAVMIMWRYVHSFCEKLKDFDPYA